MKNDLRTYNKIQKTGTGQEDGYTTGCLLDYVYLKNYQKMEAIDSGKHQTLDADPKTIQQLNFPGNLGGEAKENILDFFYKRL